MNFEHIQKIVIIYGTKKSVEKYAKKQHNKINMVEIENNKHSYFNDIRKFLWKGD